MATNNTKPAVWKIESLVNALEGCNEEGSKIAIPKFQRTLVWNTAQQKEFIDSIKKGFPIGAFLIFKSIEKDGETTYNLIDGLQRSTALNKYMKRPTRFFDETNLTKEILGKIHTLFSDKSIEIPKEELVKKIISWISSLNGFSESEGCSSFALARNLSNELGVKMDGEELDELVETLVPELEKIKEESDISKFEVPVLIYYGDQYDLPLIFQRLNSQGTQLSKYQIYAATWTTYETFKINNTEIIEGIKYKYESLIDEGYEVEGYESSKFSSSNFSVFEYLFGLGKFLCKKYEYLFGASNKVEQEDSIGFNLINICLGLSFDKMNQLPEFFLKKDVKKLEGALLDSIEFVYKCLKGHITLKMNKRSKIAIAHSEYQIVSMIGKVFNSKYNQEFDVKSEWGAIEKNLEKNFKFYYLADIIRKHWRGPVDSKAYEVAHNERYEKPITKKTWESILQEWFDEEMQKSESARKRIPEEIILFYKYLYSYSLSAYEELSQIEYDIEHLVPVDRLSYLAKNKGLPINVLPNLCLLDSNLNKKKKALTFYQYYDKQVEDEELTREQGDLEIDKMEKYSHTRRDDLKFVNAEKFTEQEYLEFLSTRFCKVKELFYAYNKIE